MKMLNRLFIDEDSSAAQYTWQPLGCFNHKSDQKCIALSTGFYTFVVKFTDMETIVIQVKGKSKAKQVLDAIKLLNGVTNATIATADELENLSMLKACLAARKTAKATKADVIIALK